jgi:hypothetical protein
MVPANDDIVVRKKTGNPAAFYLVGTFAARDQFFVETRDEAVSHAVALARRRRVRAWFNSDDTFVLLGTFREEEPQLRRTSR